ncbi:MAG: amino acid ABC transporter permease [Pseudomonadota bacterium]
MLDKLTIIWDALPYILEGSAVTIATVLGSLALGFALGVPLAVGQVYGPRFLRRLIGVYVWFFRGMPILVLLFLFYFGLFQIINLNLSAFSASCLVLGLASSAYQSQIFRGSIMMLPQGQWKAARALGMSDAQAVRSIVLPQALRLSIPAWSNEYSILLKDSALAFVLGTPEIMARTHFVASRTYEHLTLYTTAGIIYLVITVVGLKFLRHVERKVRIPGYAAAGSM